MVTSECPYSRDCPWHSDFNTVSRGIVDDVDLLQPTIEKVRLGKVRA